MRCCSTLAAAMRASSLAFSSAAIRAASALAASALAFCSAAIRAASAF